MKLTHRWIIYGLFGLLLAALAAQPAAAGASLQQARIEGKIAEKLDGYVSAIDSSPEIKALAEEVNAKRRQEYQRISKANGQPADVVGKLAAEQIIKQLEPGSMFQSPTGGWMKR